MTNIFRVLLALVVLQSLKISKNYHLGRVQTTIRYTVNHWPMGFTIKNPPLRIEIAPLRTPLPKWDKHMTLSPVLLKRSNSIVKKNFWFGSKLFAMEKIFWP